MWGTTTMTNLLPTCAGTIAFIAMISVTAVAQNITPEPIALPSSEFPVPTSQLDALIAAGNTAALRQHAWTLWSGLTANSTQSFQGQVLPIWETWLSEGQAFSPSSQLLALGSRPRNLLSLAPPAQFAHITGNAPRALALGVAAGNSILADVKMSPDAVKFIGQSHETPAKSGQTYSYASQADLARLNAAFNQHNTPVADRKIIDFPAAATDLKIVFMTVAATGLTPIPVWAGPAASKTPSQPIPSSWTTCVAVDPTNSITGQAPITCNGTQIQAQVVPLNAFFSIRIDANEAKAVNARAKLTGKAAVAEGDFHVLVAMHVTTKEIANWTWATFWWQNGQNPPNSFPGSVDGMPDATKVKGPWRNYAMCVADSTVFPVNDPKGKPVVCFNPYLETFVTDGLDSNCMTCHARARMPLRSGPYPTTYLPNGFIDLGDPSIFGGSTKLDFVWAIQNSAH
jgi:hypothetical protein